jgi:hypothetical protein
MDQSKAKTPSRADIELTLLKLINVTRLVRMIGPGEEELNRYIEAAARVDTVAPILDPTMWMRGAKKNDCFLKIARALATFNASLPTLEEAVEVDRIANALDPNRTGPLKGAVE